MILEHAHASVRSKNGNKENRVGGGMSLIASIMCMRIELLNVFLIRSLIVFM